MEHNVPYNRMQPGEAYEGVAQATIYMVPWTQQRYNTYDRSINIGLGVMQLVCGVILMAFTVSTDSLYMPYNPFCFFPRKK